MRSYARKMLLMMMVVTMALEVTACGTKVSASDNSADSGTGIGALAITENDISEEIMLDGGWSVSDKTEITDEVREVFDRALDGMVGVSYEPVAYLGSQVVAGTNHCILCKATVVYPNAVPYYTLMYIYEDLDGNAEILGFSDVEIGNYE